MIAFIMKPQSPSGRAASLFTRKSANQTISSPLVLGQTALSAAVSRRRFIRETARAVGATLGASILLPAVAGAGQRLNAAPRPIPNGVQFLGSGTPVFHVMAPGYPGFGNAATDDPSSITNFNGHVGVTYVQGWGTHTDKTTGKVKRLPWEVDLRFMKGDYVALDGKHRHRTFALI